MLLLSFMGSEANHSKKKPPNFTPEEDFILVQAAWETKAFCKPKQAVGFEEVAKIFREAAACNRTGVTWRTVRDRFFRIVKMWRANDAKKRAKSGTAEEVTKQDEILGHIVAVLDDLEEEKQAIREAESKKKAAQKIADEIVLDCATKRRKDRESSSEKVKLQLRVLSKTIRRV